MNDDIVGGGSYFMGSGTAPIDLTPAKTVSNLIMEAIGEASMAWSETPRGIFDTTRALAIRDELIRRLARASFQDGDGNIRVNSIVIMPITAEGKLDEQELRDNLRNELNVRLQEAARMVWRQLEHGLPTKSIRFELQLVADG